MAGLLLAIVLSLIIGFATHRASICTVRTVAEIMSSRTCYMLASVGKSILWVWAATIPFLWLAPAAVTGLSGWSLTLVAVLGGLLFGLGAAINGACAYSTMARLVDGEGRMLATVAGFATGAFGFATLVGWRWLAQPAPAPALLGTLLPWAPALAVALLAWALYEAARLWRTREKTARFAELALAPRYRLSTAALLIGVPGTMLLLLYGPFGYTATFELAIEGLLGTRAPPATVRWVLLLAVLAGMLLSTLQRRSFRIDWRPQRAWLLNFGGGALMGFGTALAPGGNDALVLYGIPTLSPSALPAFAALGIGVAIGLLTLRLGFGVEARVECRNDTFVHDSWTRRSP